MFGLREWKKRERVKFKKFKSKIIHSESSKNFCSMLDTPWMGMPLDKG